MNTEQLIDSIYETYDLNNHEGHHCLKGRMHRTLRLLLSDFATGVRGEDRESVPPVLKEALERDKQEGNED